MGFVQKASALGYRAMNAMRDKRAFEVAAQPATGTDFADFARARQCLVVTYRKSGEPVPSPVNFGLANGKLYFRTDGTTAKVRRVRRDPRAAVVPCGLRGKPLGEPVATTARVLGEDEVPAAEAAIAANWSPAMKLLERGLDVGAERFGLPIVYVELAIDPTRRQ